MKQKQTNMKECDKRNTQISNKLRTIYMSSNNNRKPVTKTFTTLQHTSPNYITLSLTFKKPCVPYIGRAYRYPPDVAFYVFFFQQI